MSIVWAASYALGSGFVLGTGSVVAPAGDRAGHPARHARCSVPCPRPARAVPSELWWLAAGAMAGAVAAWVDGPIRRPKRFDTSSLIGGLAGLLAGAMFVGLAWAASGDLGTVCAWRVSVRGCCRCW